MKSRPSEKPAKKKKTTTAAKSVKKPMKKSVRAAAKKETVAKKGKPAVRKKTPTKVAAKSVSPEPVEVKTEAPPPPSQESVPPPVPPPQASDQEIEEESSLAATSAVEESSPAATPPVFVKHDLTGPDGSIRPGWEMWIGDHCFGRADSKDLLLASFERLQSPPSSFHWREVRNRMPIRGRTKRPVAALDTVVAAPDTAKVADNAGEELVDNLDEAEETPDVS